jgi:hypothetical protein
MQKLIRLAIVVYLLFGFEQAYEVPSFARQTGSPATCATVIHQS